MNQPANTARHVYRLSGEDVVTQVEIPQTREGAAAGFHCPVLRCTMRDGTHCAKRWAQSQGLAVEREKCRVCPAGRARAALLGIAVGIDMSSYDRMRVSNNGAASRDKEIERVKRWRASVEAKSAQARIAREARIVSLGEQIMAILVQAPAESAIALGRTLLGPTATSSDHTVLGAALRRLVEGGHVVRKGRTYIKRQETE